jgi:hypothetical protein
LEVIDPGGIARVLVKVPVLPPEKVIVEPINWKEPACQDE